MTDALELARQCAAAMFARDRAIRSLGIAVETVRPGAARFSMTVMESMLNGYGMAHGGVIFTLADAAFGYACNAYNEACVAQSCSINFLNPGRATDVLVADAVETTRSGRTGIYDVMVRTAQGTPIAVFRGASASIKGTVLSRVTEAERGFHATP